LRCSDWMCCAIILKHIALFYANYISGFISQFFIFSILIITLFRSSDDKNQFLYKFLAQISPLAPVFLELHS